MLRSTKAEEVTLARGPHCIAFRMFSPTMLFGFRVYRIFGLVRLLLCPPCTPFGSRCSACVVERKTLFLNFHPCQLPAAIVVHVSEWAKKKCKTTCL